MEPASIGRSFQVNVLSSVNKKIGDFKNAVKEFSFTPKEKTKAQIVKTEEHKPPTLEHKLPTFDLGLEISGLHEKVSQALMNGSDDEVKASLVMFRRSVMRSIKGKEGTEKMIATEAFVNTVLDVATKNPKVANLCMEHLTDCGVYPHIFFALLSNSRFNPNSLNEKQVNILLQAGLSLVYTFVSIPPVMHDNVCEMVKLTKISGKDLENIIEKSIVVLSLDLADSLIKLNEGKIPNREAVMDRAIEEQDLNIVELIVKYEGKNGAQELIKKCVDGNLEVFLEKVLVVTDQSLNETQRSDFSKQAHLQGNLSLMKAINPDWKELAVSEFKNELAMSEFKNIPEELKKLKTKKLTQYFLNSNKNDVNELTLLLKNNGLISDELFNNVSEFNATAGKLIARFPNPLHQQEVFQGYGKNYENYEQQQQEYGKKHLQLVNKVIDEIKSDPSKSLESVYLKMINSTDKNPWRMGVGQTPILTRYSVFKKLALEKLDRNYENPNVSKANLDAFTISFPLDENASFKLTTIAPVSDRFELSLCFYHAAPIFDKTVPKAERVPKWYDQMGISNDWKNLVNAKVDLQDPQSIKQFESKVTEFYWKGVQLMPTVRGNSQTMLELHYILYKLNGLEPPTLSRDTVLPDCIALCSTLDEFKERYDSCWDK